MAKKVITETITAAVSVKQIAGLTGLMLIGSAAIAAILTIFLIVK